MKVHNDCSSDKVSAAAKAPPSQKSRCTSTTISARLILFYRLEGPCGLQRRPPSRPSRGKRQAAATDYLLRGGCGRQRLHRCLFWKQSVVGEMAVKLFSRGTLGDRLHQIFSAHEAAFPRLANAAKNFFAIAARAHGVYADLETAQLLRHVTRNF